MRWLAQQEHPNFRTITVSNQSFDGFFIRIGLSSISFCLLQSGLITGEMLFIDGIKIEADANKYTFVWKKSISNYETSLEAKGKQEYRKLIK